MWTQRLKELLKILLLGGALFAVVSVGLFFLKLRETAAALSMTSATTAQAIIAIQKDVDNISVMTNTALFQAEEVLHHTDVLIATENQAQKTQLAKINEVLNQLQATVQNVDKSQQAIAADLSTTLQTTDQTVQNLQPLETQLTDTVKSLQTTVEMTQPILKNTTDILGHVNAISADAQTEVHNIVYPPPKPWYAKLWGVTKLAARMLTIPLK